MSQSTPDPIFVAQVKAAIKGALVLAGVPELEINYNAIDRNGVVGARITVSKIIPPVFNQSWARPSGGQFAEWHDSDGTKYVRAIRGTLILHFDVTLWAADLDRSTEYLLGFMRELPRAVFDGQQPLGADGVTVPLPDPGNRIELSLREPIFPDDTVNAAKQYRGSVIVRAEGGVYKDKAVAVMCSTKLTVSDHFGE